MILGSCPQVAPAPWLLSGARVMGEYIGGEQSTYCVQVSVGLRLVEAAYQGLVVLFGRHSARAFPFAESCNEAIIPRSSTRCSRKGSILGLFTGLPRRKIVGTAFAGSRMSRS